MEESIHASRHRDAGPAPFDRPSHSPGDCTDYSRGDFLTGQNRGPEAVLAAGIEAEEDAFQRFHGEQFGGTIKK
jgi:hypothetical protein